MSVIYGNQILVFSVHKGKLRNLVIRFRSSLRRIMMESRQTVSTALGYLGYVANIVLLAALGLGLYTRWMHSQDIAILVIAFLGLFVFILSCTLVHYFSLVAVGYCLSRLWLGCLIGVVAFTTEHSMVEHEMLKVILEVMDILFISSLVFSLIGQMLERVFHLVGSSETNPIILTTMEMIGLAISSLVTGTDFLTLPLLVLGFGLTIMLIRLKSLLGCLNLIAFITICSTVIFPKLLVLPANPFALCCFIGRMSIEPLLDLYFSGLTTLQRWQPLLNKSQWLRRLIILGTCLMQVAFFSMCAKLIPRHKEWFIVVPLFGAFSTVWVVYHIIFLISLWKLSNKITDCNATYSSLSEENSSITRIMEAKGVRHFSLISQRLSIVTIVTTILLGGLHWTTKSALSTSLWLISIPLELTVVSLLWELGSVLGGRCVGYALMAPAAYNAKNTGVTVLPCNIPEELSSRATHTLNQIQRFFSCHLIDNYGCDFSSSGLTLHDVQTKLTAFFSRTTEEGPRFDTYLVYYSGPVYDNGDWALVGGEKLTYEVLLRLWLAADAQSGARLILMLDTESSHEWYVQVVRTSTTYIALQTVTRDLGGDPELYNNLKVGDFSREWLDFNMANVKEINWRDKRRVLRPMFGVSRIWHNFTFHLPTHDDITHHWAANFPKLTRPLIKLTNFPKVGHLSCICHCTMGCLRKLKWMFFPPRVYNTGHGFKLVRT